MTLQERRAKWELRKKARRAARIRKFAIISAMIALPVLIVTIFILGFSNKAEAKEDKVYYKYYTSYEIKPGDTLCSIADNFMEGYDSKDEYIKELKLTNNIHNADNIRSGQIIHVPYYSTVFQ